jgi:murein L,D-transpeptidase YafK
MRLRFVLFSVVLTGMAAVVFVARSGGWYPAVDRLWMASRHLNPIIHYSLGYSLPGTPDLESLDARLAARNLKRGDPVFIRIFKSELRLELWMKQGGTFIRFADYPICTWSGRLGPKLKEGDRQSPEGFYTVAKDQLNPNSRWHRSFNVGFPNLYDRFHGRTGSLLMVHGGCASIGCYAMTNGVISELWTLIGAAMDAGQERFGVHVYPFRLTDQRLAAYGEHQWAAFWRDLKPGYDLFERDHVPPEIAVCNGSYVATPGQPNERTAPALQEKCPPGPSNQQS